VVEVGLSGWPLEDFKIFAIVFGMAADTIQVALGGVGGAAMKTFAPGNQFSNLAVARQTAQLARCCAEGMITGALQRAVEEVMRFRKGAW
jgi:hypothetical protein